VASLKTPVNSLINGIAADYLNINDRSIHYGDGLFETILCDNNKLYYWQQHLQRLQASAEQLNINCPQEQTLLDDISRMLAENKPQAACAIKIIISRGAGERGYKFSRNIAASRLVMLSPLDAGHSSLLNRKLLSGELFICKQQASINESLAGLKHLNRLENVMARNEWNADYIDGLMLNANQHVIEGTMSNLFAIRDGQLFTPDLNLSGVNGIMREIIIGLASKNNIETAVTDLTIDDLRAMDELFISNSLIGMKAVTKLGDSLYESRQLSDMFFAELLKTEETHAQTV